MKKEYLQNIGLVLKAERIRKKMELKQVCCGICVPSYLSKIENGKVNADETIIKNLAKVLGLEEIVSSAFITEKKLLVDKYYFNFCYGLETKEIYKKLLEVSEKLEKSSLVIDWYLIKGFEENKFQAELETFKAYFSKNQKGYFNIQKAYQMEKSNDSLKLLEEANDLLNTSFSQVSLLGGYYNNSEYEKVQKYEKKVEALALEEGNLYQLINCYSFVGSCYSCLENIDLMKIYYEKCMKLLLPTNWIGERESIYYNLGATYLQIDEFKTARDYFSLIKEEFFLLYHKKALLEVREKNFQKAEEYIKKMKEYIKKDDELYKIMIREVEMEMEENYENNPSNIFLIEELQNQLIKKRHFGYINFYKKIIEKIYIANRKYKKAYRLEKKLLEGYRGLRNLKN